MDDRFYNNRRPIITRYRLPMLSYHLFWSIADEIMVGSIIINYLRDYGEYNPCEFMRAKLLPIPLR